MSIRALALAALLGAAGAQTAWGYNQAVCSQICTAQSGESARGYLAAEGAAPTNVGYVDKADPLNSATDFTCACEHLSAKPTAQCTREYSYSKIKVRHYSNKGSDRIADFNLVKTFAGDPHALTGGVVYLDKESCRTNKEWNTPKEGAYSGINTGNAENHERDYIEANAKAGKVISADEYKKQVAEQDAAFKKTKDSFVPEIVRNPPQSKLAGAAPTIKGQSDCPAGMYFKSTATEYGCFEPDAVSGVSTSKTTAKTSEALDGTKQMSQPSAGASNSAKKSEQDPFADSAKTQGLADDGAGEVKLDGNIVMQQKGATSGVEDGRDGATSGAQTAGGPASGKDAAAAAIAKNQKSGKSGDKSDNASKRYAGTKDDCANSVYARTIQLASESYQAEHDVAPTRDQLMTQIKTHKEFERQAIDEYGCSNDISGLGTAETINQIAQMTGQVGAGAAAAVSNQRVQQASQDPTKNFNAEALRASADALRYGGYTQTTLGAVQIGTAIKARSISNRQENIGNRVGDMENAGENGEYVASTSAASSDNLTVGGAMAALKDKKFVETDNAEQAEIQAQSYQEKGEGQASADSAKHKALQDKASNQAVGSAVQAAMNIGQAAVNFLTAHYMDKQADELEAATAQAPGTQIITATPQGGGVAGGVTPPSLGDVPAGVTNDATAVQDKLTDIAPLDVPDSLLGGGGPAGGLASAPIAAKDPGRATAATSGGGGGGGGGLGGGRGGSAGGGADGRGTDALTSSGRKFTDPNGGAGFANTGGGGGKRNGDTGMDPNAILAALLPKKDEDRKTASILDFNGKEQGTVGPGNVNDGSILGRDSNLFLRVSGATQGAFKKGNLR